MGERILTSCSVKQCNIHHYISNIKPFSNLQRSLKKITRSRSSYLKTYTSLSTCYNRIDFFLLKSRRQSGEESRVGHPASKSPKCRRWKKVQKNCMEEFLKLLHESKFHWCLYLQKEIRHTL